MSAAPQDWFSQNAPKQGASDWFAQHAPAVAPNAGLAPPAGGPTSQPMEPSHLAQALTPATTSSSAIANPQQPAEQFALDNPEEQGKLAVAAGIGAAGTGLPVAAPSIARVASQHPVISNLVGSAAISQARNIPVVGKFIPPMAEMWPWMRSAGGEPEAGEPSPPSAKGPIASPEAVPQAVRPSEVPKPVTESAPPRSEWPPPEPTGSFDKPVASPRGISDLRDDEAVREDIKDRVAQADRKVFASHRERNDVSVPKGVLTGQIDKPVTYTKSRIAKVGSSEPAAVTTPETDDLTPILKKSLAQARKQKGASR